MSIYNEVGERFFVGVDHQAWLLNFELGECERKGPPPKGYMLLRTTDTSPYARKVRIVADYLSLADKIILTPVSFLPTDTELIRCNPIGKAPVLVLDGGKVIHESNIIIEFFCALAPQQGETLLPPDAEQRLLNSLVGAVADAVVSAQMAIVSEYRVHETAVVSEYWVARQSSKVDRCLNHLSDNIATLPIVSTGAVAIACALGYLDWRRPEWRNQFPTLVKWLKKFCEEFPSYEMTNSL